MIFRRKNTANRYANYSQHWIKFFCLLPRCVEAHWVWLENIEIYAQWRVEGLKGKFEYSIRYGYVARRLTERQKKRLGITW